MNTADQSGYAPRERSPLRAAGSGSDTRNASGEANRVPFDDVQIERLLTAFYDREMPAALRAATLGPVATPAPVATVARASLVSSESFGPATSAAASAESRRAAIIGLACAAAVLVAAGFLLNAPLSDSVQTARRERAGRVPARDVSPAIAGGARSEAQVPADLPIVVLPASGDGKVEYSVTERDEPVETRFLETEHGPVEQRSRRRVTNVSVVDPETGSKVEVEFPEVTVEIFPIKK